MLKNENTELKMSKSDLIKFIERYKINECLWNIRSKDFKRNDLKVKAWTSIADEFSTNIEGAKRKMKSLRSCYVSEKKKVLASKASGSSEDIYKPNLFYYDNMKFLDESIILRKSSYDIITDDSVPRKLFIESMDKNLNKKIITNPIILRNDVNTDLQFDCSKNKRSKLGITEYILDKTQSEEDNVFMSFGKSVVTQLQDLPPLNSCEAMEEIQSVLSRHRANVIRESMNLPPQKQTIVYRHQTPEEQNSPLRQCVFKVENDE